MTEPKLILHVGAPKCGSSALQSALTRSPDLQDGAKRDFRYVATRYRPGLSAKGPILCYGAAVQRDGIRSRFGFVSFPDLPNIAPRVMQHAIEKIINHGLDRGHIPIISNEGWITRHAAFAEILETLGHPPVDVVAFLRPPLEWLNASFWQWGVWSTPNLTTWVDRSAMTYSFGLDLEAWSRIPNVRMKVGTSKPDIVNHFATLYDVRLEAGPTRNISSPPALIGFLLRNRRFRPHAHEPQVEFIFQRWCPNAGGRSPWAVSAADVHRFRPTVALNIAALRRVLPPKDCDRLFADPRWLQETCFHEELWAGMTPLDTPGDLPPLLDNLEQGVAQAAQVAGDSPPPAIRWPSANAGLADWDQVLAATMDQLLHYDASAREKMARGRGFYSLLHRIRDGLS